MKTCLTLLIASLLSIASSNTIYGYSQSGNGGCGSTIKVFTGNSWRDVVDLQVWGAWESINSSSSATETVEK